MKPSARLLALAIAGSVIGVITALAAPPAKRTHFTAAPVSVTKTAPAAKSCDSCAPAATAAKSCGTACGDSATVVRRAGTNTPRQLPPGGCGQNCS